jgi:hypothetical protein
LTSLGVGRRSGRAQPPRVGRELGAARLGEMVGGREPPLADVSTGPMFAGRGRVMFVSNRTTLEFPPEAVRGKCVIVPLNALRPEDETLHALSFLSSILPPPFEGRGGGAAESPSACLCR